MYSQAVSEGLESMANLEELDIKSENVGARGCHALASSFKGVWRRILVCRALASSFKGVWRRILVCRALASGFKGASSVKGVRRRILVCREEEDTCVS